MNDFIDISIGNAINHPVVINPFPYHFSFTKWVDGQSAQAAESQRLGEAVALGSQVRQGEAKAKLFGGGKMQT